MAGYVSEQDESNPELWLALLPTRECAQCSTRKNLPAWSLCTSHIMNSSLAKVVWSRWLDIGVIPFCLFMALTPSHSINTQKKDLVNTQRSWPHKFLVNDLFILWFNNSIIRADWDQLCFLFFLTVLIIPVLQKHWSFKVWLDSTIFIGYHCHFRYLDKKEISYPYLLSALQ